MLDAPPNLTPPSWRYRLKATDQRLRKPLERRLYELARKHCGHQVKWHIGLEKLRLKSGSSSKSKEFRRMVAAIVEADIAHGHFPDYAIRLEDELVVFRPRPEFTAICTQPGGEGEAGFEAARVVLPAGAFEAARKHAAGYDVYQLEADWRAMLADKQSVPDKPVGSFIAYVKWYVGEHGSAR